MQQNTEQNDHAVKAEQSDDMLVDTDSNKEDNHDPHLDSIRSHKRRPHTKSRNGCATCKRRRVKCDEGRPVCKNCLHLRLDCVYSNPAVTSCADLQLMNLQLLHHYDNVVARTISDSGISTLQIWSHDVVEMGLQYPFLMHAILMFSATHLSQGKPKEFCNVVVQHRSMALTLLRSEVQHINSNNLDPLVATSVLLILDAMANASLPSKMTPSSLPASTWLHHVRGAATILLAVGVLPPTSKFYSFMGVDLLDLASCYPPGDPGQAPHTFSNLQCHFSELSELYPVTFDSPYFSSLAFLEKLHDQRNRADFILRVFSFPALMDAKFVGMLSQGDRYAKTIVSSYYQLVRQYVKDRHGRVWFFEGVSTVLPIDMDAQFGGLGFVTDALPVSQTVDSILAKFDESFAAADENLAKISKLVSRSTKNAPATGKSSESLNDLEGFCNAMKIDNSTNSKESLAGFSESVNIPNVPTSTNLDDYNSSSHLRCPPPFQQKRGESQNCMANQSQTQDQRVQPQQYSALHQKLPSGSPPQKPYKEHLPMFESYVSQLLPHTYGRIRKHIMSNGTSVHKSTVLPGSRASSAPSVQSMSHKAYRSGRFQNHHIVRPGLMSLPVDPNIPNDLFDNFDFGEDTSLGDVSNANLGTNSMEFDANSLQWCDPSQDFFSLESPQIPQANHASLPNGSQLGHIFQQNPNSSLQVPTQITPKDSPPQFNSDYSEVPVAIPIKQEMDYDDFERMLNFDEEVEFEP